MIMKNIVGLLFLAARLAAAPADFAAWQWVAPFAVGQAGMVRLEVPPPVLDVSRPDLADLRVVSPAGVETPFLVEVAARRGGDERDAREFTLALAGRTTVIEVASGTSAVIDAIRLLSPAREFLKSVTLEGRQGGGPWQEVAANAVIFRQAGGAERLTVKLPPGPWERLRCTVDDERAEPVPFTGVRVQVAAEQPASVELPVAPGAREEVAGETRLRLDLGAGNLNLAAILLDVSDPVFSRSCRLAIAAPTPEGGTRMEPLASGTIYRVVGEHGVTVEHLAIALPQRVGARYLVATFHNGDSPPLTISGARVRCYPTLLALHAAPAGTWQLLTGNRRAGTPDYDLNPLRGALTAAGGRRIVPGALENNADYQLPAALPGVATTGVDIGLGDWSCRRAVRAASSGVIRIELDARALAGCRLDLGDLRLVQNGRQIPYLIVPGKVPRELPPVFSPLPTEPQRPTVSRWELTLPVADVPAVELVVRSPSPMFVRRLVAQEQRKDELGYAWTETVGTANWTKSAAADEPLVIALGGRRVLQKLVLETDNGDNPPIEISSVTLRFAAPSITAKLSDPAALFLYYGNPKAAAPQYDLRLVRTELLAADRQAAALGDEEKLRPEAAAKRGIDAGSPWLWLALAAMVAALLVIVAKLLPRPATG